MVKVHEKNVGNDKPFGIGPAVTLSAEFQNMAAVSQAAILLLFMNVFIIRGFSLELSS